MEPLDEVSAAREAARRCAQVIQQSIAYIVTAPNATLAAWQVAFSIGSPCCEGRSMDDVAKLLGVTRAAVSKGSKILQRGMGIGGSGYNKSARACKAASDARRRVITGV